MKDTTSAPSAEHIAIVGLSGQFPQSSTVDAFWENLVLGKELISFFSDQELREAGIDPAVLTDPSYIKAKGYLEDAECFDAEFFGFSSREAELLDPQQRRLLEWAWSALEVAGYDAEQYQGLIGVFVCSSLSSYFYLNVLPHIYSSPHRMQDEMLMVMGNEKDFLATRISYKMNLKGPSKSIQTACSSSLVAVHDACQNLLNYECDMALAGGVSITFPQKSGYVYSAEGIASSDGHCRAFDHRSSGTVTGNGGGIVVLKRLSDAIREGDTIYSVIRGSCVNNDGASKVGYTAPSVTGQANAIISAQMAAQVEPETISYIECHGTGTALGDPVEIKALTTAYLSRAKKMGRKSCALGSVKTNIGHLDAAAGIAGLIKTALALRSKQIPATLHFEQPNPKIVFDETPFYVNAELTPWESKYSLCRAGVSSFGIGGTNAHLILEEPPSAQSTDSQYISHLLPFSAKNESCLKQILSNFLSALPEIPHRLADIAYTLQVGRHPFEYRATFLCSSKEELEQMIRNYLASGTTPCIVDSIWADASSRWLAGEKIQWETYYRNERRQRVPLPSYPFTKNRYFIAPHSSRFRNEKPPEPKAVSTPSPLAPLNRIEELLIAMWKTSLKTEEIDAEDNFFNLGGDSLIALEVTDNIRRTFYVDVSLQQMFDHPTVRLSATLLKGEILKKINDFSDEETAYLAELI